MALVLGQLDRAHPNHQLASPSFRHSSSNQVWIRSKVGVPKGWKWRVFNVEGRAKVDGPSGAKSDGLMSQTGRSGFTPSHIPVFVIQTDLLHYFTQSNSCSFDRPFSQTIHFQSLCQSSLTPMDRPLKTRPIWMRNFLGSRV